MTDTKLWPISFEEGNPEGTGPQIRVEDMACYGTPPGHRARYTEAGWVKAQILNIRPVISISMFLPQ